MVDVFILVLNWNNYRDTIECLESIFRNDYNNYKVIVCDNNSSDNSVEHIEEWANGDLAIEIGIENPLRNCTFPPVKKPIRYVEYLQHQIDQSDLPLDDSAELILIRNANNLGFAGGNNVGLRYIQKAGEYQFVWILNNDTVIAPDSLKCLIARVRQVPGWGMCGSTIYYYHEPHTIQLKGGAEFNYFFGTSKLLGNREADSGVEETAFIESKMNYVAAASMLVNRKFIETIGLMSEDYFLYFEEIDWAERNKGKFELLYAADSIVYHKEGATIGSSKDICKKSSLSDFYSFESRILFFKKYYPTRLIFIYAAGFIYILHRLLNKRYENAKQIMKCLINGLT